jgi:hypothetical protein
MQLAQMVTRAYLQKQGDLTGVTMTNVNNLPAAHQEIAERYDVCLLNDSNKARGEENSMKFKEYVAFANVQVAHGQPAYIASILHIAKFYLHPFETSRASLYKSAIVEKAETKATRTVNHVQTAAKEPSASTVKESALHAQVAALTSQLQALQEAPKAPAIAPAYNRAPPPTTYIVSSPYPSIAVGRGPLSRGSRNCLPPKNGEGVPSGLGVTAWDDGLWRRARAKVTGFARLALHPTCASALAKCRPCDETMTAPRIEDIPPVDSGAAWTNENGCAYCAFRPRAPVRLRKTNGSTVLEMARTIQLCVSRSSATSAKLAPARSTLTTA